MEQNTRRDADEGGGSGAAQDQREMCRLDRVEARLLRIERYLNLPAALMPERAERRDVAAAGPPPRAESTAPQEDASAQRYAALIRSRDEAHIRRHDAPRADAPQQSRESSAGVSAGSAAADAREMHAAAFAAPIPPPRYASNGPAVERTSPAEPAPRLQPFVSPATPPATAGGSLTRSTSAPAARAGVLGYEKRPIPSGSQLKQNAIEQIIGLKLAGWVGAIVLVIGAGLGIKYAYDQGWLGGLPPAWRLTLMYLGGFGLLAAGEIVYRRINKISATGLFGAGVATLFLVSYAGHGYYSLYQRETAFTLMALSTLIGAAVAMRGKLVSIGALSLIGGLLAPLVLQGDSNLLTPFLCYLLMLQVVALVLSWWGRSERWWSLRGLSLAGTTLWAATVIDPTAQPWGAPLLFVLIYALLYQLELVLSIGRTQNSTDDAKGSGAGVTFSAIVTALACAAVLNIFGKSSHAARGTWMVAFSAATLAMGIALRQVASKRPALRGLAQGYRVQSAIVLLTAVPVAFSGSAVTIGWAGLALALAAVGAMTGDRPARYTAPLAWALAVVKLATWSVDPVTHDAACATRLVALGQLIAEWTILAWGLVVVGHAVARLHSLSSGLGGAARDAGPCLHSIKEREMRFARGLSAFATALFAIATILSLPPLGSTGVLLAYAWLLVGVDAIDRRLGLLAQAGAVLVLATAKWAVLDMIATRFAPGWPAAAFLPIINPLVLNGLALAASIVLFHRLHRGRIHRMLIRGGGADDSGDSGDSNSLRVALASLAVLVWAGTLEIDRLVAARSFPGLMLWPEAQVRQFAWTAWWTIGAVTPLVIAHLRDRTAIGREPILRRLCTVPVVLAAKYLVFDTLGFRLLHDPAPATVMANLQTFAGAFVFAALVLVRYLLDDAELKHVATTRCRLLAGAAAILMLLWLGTLEIDRAFATSLPVMSRFADAALAEQVALSIFWSIFAIGGIAAGFRFAASGLRYFGLALFAFTLLKVGMVDLRDAETGYRILSFSGLGGLLLGTSVLYGKLSPKLLRPQVASAE